MTDYDRARSRGTAASLNIIDRILNSFKSEMRVLIKEELGDRHFFFFKHSHLRFSFNFDFSAPVSGERSMFAAHDDDCETVSEPHFREPEFSKGWMETQQKEEKKTFFF